MTGKKTRKGKTLDLSYKPEARIFNRGLTITSGASGKAHKPVGHEEKRHQGSLPHQYPWIDADEEAADQNSEDKKLSE